MTVTFRNDVTAFTTAFALATNDERTHTVDTYHLLDTYAAADVADVARFVAHCGDIKPAAIATRFKNTAKRIGIVNVLAGVAHVEFTNDHVNTARALAGVWSRSRPGFVNLVCIPLTRREFASALAHWETIGELPPASLGDLLNCARTAIVNIGRTGLTTIEPTDAEYAIVDRIAPALAGSTTPTDDATDVDATDVDTRTVADLKTALDALNVEYPKRAKRTELLALVAVHTDL